MPARKFQAKQTSGSSGGGGSGLRGPWRARPATSKYRSHRGKRASGEAFGASGEKPSRVICTRRFALPDSADSCTDDECARRARERGLSPRPLFAAGGSWVCCDCGLDHGPVYEREYTAASPPPARSRYGRRYYAAELLKNLTLDGPKPPAAFLDFFRRNWELQGRGDASDHYRVDIQRYLRSLTLPACYGPCFATKDRARARTRYSHFVDKWKTFKAHVPCAALRLPPPAITQALLECFKQFEAHFERNRHARTCPEVRACHRYGACRSSMFPYQLVLAEICRKIAPAHFAYLAPDFGHPVKPRQAATVERIRDIIEHQMGPFHFSGASVAREPVPRALTIF